MANRQTHRVQAWDYSGYGWYFVTFVTHRRRPMLASFSDGQVWLTPAGEAVSAAWHSLPDHFARISLDAFVVMPDHVHGLFRIAAPAHVQQRTKLETIGNPAGPTRGSVGAIIGSMKAAASRTMRRSGSLDHVGPIWQRNYYERIVRSDEMLSRVRRYIHDNPAKWIAKAGSF